MKKISILLFFLFFANTIIRAQGTHQWLKNKANPDFVVSSDASKAAILTKDRLSIWDLNTNTLLREHYFIYDGKPKFKDGITIKTYTDDMSFFYISLRK